MPNETRDAQFVWNVITEIGEQERHFNNLESEYRKLASTWLLAFFTAIGFILGTDAIVMKEFFIAGISLAGAVGIFLLWIIDLLVYHRLLHACFEEGKRLEESNFWLPRMRTRMTTSVKGGDVTPRIIWFYIIGISIPLLIACLALDYAIYERLHYPLVVPILNTFVWCVFIVLLARIMYRKTLERADVK